MESGTEESKDKPLKKRTPKTYFKISFYFLFAAVIVFATAPLAQNSRIYFIVSSSVFIGTLCFCLLFLMAGIGSWINGKYPVFTKVAVLIKFGYKKIRSVRWYWWAGGAACLILLYLCFHLYWVYRIGVYKEKAVERYCEIRDQLYGKDLGNASNAFGKIKQYGSQDRVIKLFNCDFDTSWENREYSLKEKVGMISGEDINFLLDYLAESSEADVLTHPFFLTINSETLFEDRILLSAYGYRYVRSPEFKTIRVMALVCDLYCRYYRSVDDTQQLDRYRNITCSIFRKLIAVDSGSLELKAMYAAVLLRYLITDKSVHAGNLLKALHLEIESIIKNRNEIRKIDYLLNVMYTQAVYDAGLLNGYFPKGAPSASVFTTWQMYNYMVKVDGFYTDMFSSEQNLAGEYLFEYFWHNMKPQFFHGIFIIYFQEFLKDRIGLNESYAKLYLVKLSIDIEKYFEVNGEYPDKLEDLNLEVNIEKGVLLFSGYEFGFLKVPGKDKSSDLAYSLYAKPQSYAYEGELTFLLDDKGNIYSLDRGNDETIPEWPDKETLENWEQ